MRMRRIVLRTCLVAGLGGLVTLLPAGASAGIDSPTPEGLAYLRDEPVTLLDLGFLRLRRDLDRAALPLTDAEYEDAPPRTGVFYNWRRDRIHAYVSFAVAPERRTSATCIQRYLALTAALLGGAPEGPDRARGYLTRIFSHVGPRRWHARAPRTFGADLEAAFRFSVTLTGAALDQRAGDLHTIKCSGALDAAATTLTIRESGV